MATLGSRGLDEGGLAAELAVQIVAAARAAEHVDVQAREHVLLELRSGDRDAFVQRCVQGRCVGATVALPMDDEAFNPVKSVRSHKSQATLQQLLNTGWRVDHSYPSSYVRHEYRKKGQVLSLDSLDLNEDTRFEADEVSSEVMTSTIIVLSRLHRPLVGEPGSSTSVHVRRPAQSN